MSSTALREELITTLSFDELTDLPHWSTLLRHLRTWYRRPPAAEDGCALEELARVEARLGFALPARVREWNRILGRRSEAWGTDYRVTLEEALARWARDETDGLLVWTEPQGVFEAEVHERDMRRDDPPVSAQGVTLHPSFTEFVTFMLLHTDLSYRWDVEPEVLKPGVHGGEACLDEPLALAQLQEVYPVLASGPEAFAARALVLGDEETLLLVGEGAGPGAILAWAATAAAWRRLHLQLGVTWTQTWIQTDEDPPRETPPAPPARRALAPSERVVPELVGLDESEAISVAGVAGLLVRTDGRHHPTEPAGRVLSQDPEPGTTLRGHGPVTTVASLGPQRILLPSLAGLDVDQARQRLGVLGLEPGEIRRRRRLLASGVVVETNPPPGASVPPGTAVDADPRLAGGTRESRALGDGLPPPARPPL